MKRRILIFAIALTLIFAVACSRQQSQKPMPGTQSSVVGMGDIKNIRVTANQATVKSGCSKNATTVNTTPRDNTMDVLSKVMDWYAVKLPNNAVGFVHESEAKPIVLDGPTPNIPTGTPGTGGTTPINPGAGSPGTPTGAPAPAGNQPANPGAQTNPNTTSLTAEEQQMLNLVNQARAQNGAAPLQVDPKLTNTARLKSQDMINNNYFSHNSPTYGSPFDMMKSFGISYVKAGENLAGNQSVQAAHNALMNSPGHRKNILDPDFTHIGIGIKRGGTYGMMFTQQFVSRPK